MGALPLAPATLAAQRFSAQTSFAPSCHHRTQARLLRFGAARTAVVASASAESGPTLRKPELVSKPVVREAPSEEHDAAAAKPSSSSATTAAPARGVTIEFQRSQAKAMQRYFRELNAQKAAEKAQVFGWTKKNEIGNGRWVMFGFAVGLLTEYATGVDFIDQLKMIVSFLGIADVE